jgi:hypothetical protein
MVVLVLEDHFSDSRLYFHDHDLMIVDTKENEQIKI